MGAESTGRGRTVQARGEREDGDEDFDGATGPEGIVAAAAAAVVVCIERDAGPRLKEEGVGFFLSDDEGLVVCTVRGTGSTSEAVALVVVQVSRGKRKRGTATGFDPVIDDILRS